MFQQIVQFLQGPDGPFVVIAIAAVAIFLIMRDGVQSPNRRRTS